MESKVISEKRNMTYLSWSRIRHSSGTAGSFLKAQETIGGKKIYYKLSDYDPVNGIVGHEAVNEIIVSRLLDILNIRHISYQLIRADVLLDGKLHETWLSASENFRAPGEQKIALDAFFEVEKKQKETPLEFCIRMGWQDYIYEMLVVDFLIANRDRHGANIEVLRDTRKKQIRLAPLFDHGLSLLFSCKADLDQVKAFDVMKDVKVQCFVGSSSACDNLRLIEEGKQPILPELKETDKELLFEDLDRVLPGIYQEKIWEMIWKRWEYYADFCHQR